MLAEAVGRTVGPDAVVAVVDCTIAREGGLDLVLEDTFALRTGEPLLAFSCVFIGLPPRHMAAKATRRAMPRSARTTPRERRKGRRR